MWKFSNFFIYFGSLDPSYMFWAIYSSSKILFPWFTWYGLGECGFLYERLLNHNWLYFFTGSNDSIAAIMNSLLPNCASAPSSGLQRRSSTDNAALRSRLSLVVGRPSTINRQSVAGGGPGNRLLVAGGGAGVGALGALARATPARNVLSSTNNYLAPLSTQSQ